MGARFLAWALRPYHKVVHDQVLLRGVRVELEEFVQESPQKAHVHNLK